MKPVKSVLAASALLFGLAACTSLEPSETPTPADADAETTATLETADAPAEAVTAPPPGPPSFSTAILRNLPSGIVAGAETPRTFTQTETLTDFSAASDYAEAMQSFAFLVWHDGALKYAEYFAPHNETLRPESASMHKSVAALVIGAAIDAGYISGTDAEIGTYITEWAEDPRGDITIEQLLTMSSGLKPLSSDGGMQSDSMRFMRGENARETLLNLELSNAPGSVFHYAGTVNQLLGLIIERTSGQPYEQVLSDRIWAPIGAGDALVWHNEPDGFARTHTGLLAVAEDWLKIGLLVKDLGALGDDQIVSADFVAAMTSPSSANPNYGYQTWLGTTFEAQRYYNDAKQGFAILASEPFLVDDMIYFDGFGGQRVYISRSLDLVIVRSGEIRFDWDDTKLPNLVITALQAD
ncbi:MAG: serine hydrolase domain-containing protein [Pseudomonadota bacterium]